MRHDSATIPVESEIGSIDCTPIPRSAYLLDWLELLIVFQKMGT